MAKDKSKNKEEMKNTETDTTATAEAAAPEVSLESSSELATVAPAAIATTTSEVIEADAWMSLLRKETREQLVHTTPPSPEELELAVNELPTALRQAFFDMRERQSPQKEGIDMASEFRVANARILHGASKDDTKPDAAVPGTIYTSDGRVLCMQNEKMGKMMQPPIPTVFRAAVVRMEAGRLWFLKPNQSPPEGVQHEGNGPVCSSPDRQRGFKFGACSGCPYRPMPATMSKGERACADTVTLYLMLRDFSGFYTLTVKGTSLGNGIRSLTKAFGAQKKPWERYFDFGLKPESNNDGSWYSLTATVSDERASEAEALVMRELSAEILFNMRRPELERLYTMGSRPTTVEQAADMKSLLASTEGGSTTPSNASNDM